jgi:hypothetical protein
MPISHGIMVRVNWKQVPIGASVFIPGVDTDDLKEQIEEETALLGCRVRMLEVGEGELMGLRVWRVA